MEVRLLAPSQTPGTKEKIRDPAIPVLLQLKEDRNVLSPDRSWTLLDCPALQQFPKPVAVF